MPAGKTLGEARPDYNVLQLTEQFEREKRHIRIQEKFIPTKLRRMAYPEMPITSKFYTVKDHAAQDRQKMTNEFQKIVAYNVKRGPRERFPFPVCESHCYGWYQGPLVPMDRNDRRFYQPKPGNEDIKMETLIRQEYGYKRSWSGTPFILT